MKIEVTYDNEENGEVLSLRPHELVLLGVTPSVLDGHIATYEFPDSTDDEDIFDALGKSDWCFTSASRVEDRIPNTPGPNF